MRDILLMAMIAVTLLGVAACGGESTPMPTASPAVPFEESALAQQRGGLATVIIGQVVQKTREQEEPSPIGGIGCPCTDRYGFWRVKVERYLANPQPYDEITYKAIEAVTRSDGTPAVRLGEQPPLPRAGGRAVFFLKRRITSLFPLLTGDTYGGFQAIKRIEDGLVDVAPYGGQHDPEWVPLDDFVDSIVAMASLPAAPEEPGWQGTGPPPTPTAPPAPTPSPWPRFTTCSGQEEEPPCGPGADVGRPYPYTLYTHCGVRAAFFDGRRWIVDPVLTDSGTPPEDWPAFESSGEMKLVTADLARFTSKSGLVAGFRPLPEGAGYPWRPCK